MTSSIIDSSMSLIDYLTPFLLALLALGLAALLFLECYTDLNLVETEPELVLGMSSSMMDDSFFGDLIESPEKSSEYSSSMIESVLSVLEVTFLPCFGRSWRILSFLSLRSLV